MLGTLLYFVCSLINCVYKIPPASLLSLLLPPYSSNLLGSSCVSRGLCTHRALF